MVIRFLLGVAESVVTPGFVLYTSMFYTRREQVMRTMLWAAMQGAFSIISSLLSYGLGHITNTALKPWMYIFLVLGLLSLIVGFSWLFFMPETPNKAKFLTHEEQIIAVQRVAENMMGIKGYQWKNYQIWHAIKDVKTWLLLAFVLFIQLPNGGLTSFGSLVISGFGFDSFRTLLIGLPSSVVSAGSMVVWGFFSLKYGNLRTLGMIIPLLPAIAGIAAVYGTIGTGANKYGRVVAYWLINSYAVTVSTQLNLSPYTIFSILIVDSGLSVSQLSGKISQVIPSAHSRILFSSLSSPPAILRGHSSSATRTRRNTCWLSQQFLYSFAQHCSAPLLFATTC